MQEGSPGVNFKSEFMGRDEELEGMLSFWEEAQKGKGFTVFVSGEAGIGKTRLVTELMERAQHAKLIKGWCLSESLEPLMPFKEALRDSGLPHIMSESPPPKVISAYLIDSSGILVTKAEREETELDPDIFASMLTAVGNFVSDSLSLMGENEDSRLNAIGYGDHDILIQTVGELSLAVVIEGTNSEFLIDDMRRILREVGEPLKDWTGETKTVKTVEPKVSWLVESSNYDGTYMVDDPKLIQENLFDNVLLGIQRLSSEQPVILFLDDIQWADPTSLKLLHYLSRNIREHSVFILCTYRPEDIIEVQGVSRDTANYLRTTLQNMSREHLYHDIRLDRLDSAAVKSITSKMLGELPDEFSDRLYEDSGGNPFFLLEVIQLLMEEGHLREEDGLWLTDESINELHIPAKIFDVVVRRLDRLISEQREILECASVVGNEFESNVVGEITGMARMALLKNLNNIEKTHRLIHSLKKKYRFDHSKIREVLYEGINEELRQEYHRIIAESYIELYGSDNDEYLINIARHFFTAEDERAVEYLLRAGEHARSSFANEEALRFYEDALTLTEDPVISKKALEGVGDVCVIIGEYDKAEKSLLKSLDLSDRDDEKAILHRKIGHMYNPTGDYDLSIKHLDESLKLLDPNDIELCTTLHVKVKVHISRGEYDDALKSALDEKESAYELGQQEELGLAFCDIGSVYNYKGDYDKGEEYVKEAIDILKKHSKPIKLADPLNQLGMIYRYKGMLEEALECYKDSYQLLSEAGDKSNTAAVLNNIGIVYWIKGDQDKALEYQQRNMDIVQKIGDKKGIAGAMNNMGLIYEHKGDLDKALELYKGTMELVKEMGDKWGQAVIIGNIGEIYFDKGDFETSLKCYTESLELLKKVGDKTPQTIVLLNIGNVHFYNSDFEKALAYYNESLDIRTEQGDKRGMSETMCKLSETHLILGDLQKSKEYSDKALAISLDVGAKKEEAFIHNVIGKIHQYEKMWKEAEEEFDIALKLMKECEDNRGFPIVMYDKGLLYKDMGDVGKYRDCMDRAGDIFERVGMHYWATKVKETLR